MYIHPLDRWLVAMCMNCGIGEGWNPDDDADLRSKKVSKAHPYGLRQRMQSSLKTTNPSNHHFQGIHTARSYAGFHHND